MSSTQQPPEHHDVSPARSLHYGDIVKVRGLTSPAGKVINGRTATVLRYPTADGRAECHIPRHPRTVGIKPENLVKLFPGYVVKESPTNGLGIFATRDFAAGETILEEVPLVHDNTMQWPHDELSTTDWQFVAQLAPVNAQPGSDDCPAVSDELLLRLRHTNEFAHAGICPVMSRANHACDARAQFEWDFDRHVELLYAVAPITAGDEIFVTYTSDMTTTEERQSRLMFTKGFACKCGLCSLDPEEQAERDSAVERMQNCHAAIPHAAQWGYPVGVAAVRELVSICEEYGSPADRMLVPAVAIEAMDMAVAHGWPDHELLQ